MKKIIFAVLLLAGISFGQTTGISEGDGNIWTDSLYYGVPGDSVWILQTNFAHNEYRFFLKGNANSPVDSIGLQLGSVRYNNGGIPIDTVWGSYTGLTVAAGTVAVRMVNTSGGVDFLLKSSAQLLKISLLNHRATLATRKITLTMNARK